MTGDAPRAEEMRLRYLTEAIQTATPAGRLSMLFDALEMDLTRADMAFEAKDIKGISDRLIHAQDILIVLRDTIDLSVWEPAARLQALYDYLWAELVKSNMDKDRARAEGVRAHVTQLAVAWREAARMADGGEPNGAHVAGVAGR